MNWRGKAIGGSIGSMFGPWGALAGAAVGHVLVDRKQAPSEKEALRLLAVTAGARSAVAGVDGRYTPVEDKTIRAILCELNQRLGTRLSAHELTYLIDDSSRIDRSLARLAAAAQGQPELSRAATVWLWRTSVSDGDATAAETDCVMSFAKHAGLSAEDARLSSLLYIRPATTATDQARHAACAVLGIPYQASAAQIKTAYRALSQTYHPDKHAGLDPAIRALTAEKFAQIKNAYDTLCGAPMHAQEWVVRPAGSNRLAPASANMTVSCFMCGIKHLLPEEDKIVSARCTACQTLLALDPEIARQLP